MASTEQLGFRSRIRQWRTALMGGADSSLVI